MKLLNSNQCHILGAVKKPTFIFLDRKRKRQTKVRNITKLRDENNWCRAFSRALKIPSKYYALWKHKFMRILQDKHTWTSTIIIVSIRGYPFSPNWTPVSNELKFLMPQGFPSFSQAAGFGVLAFGGIAASKLIYDYATQNWVYSKKPPIATDWKKQPASEQKSEQQSEWDIKRTQQQQELERKQQLNKEFERKQHIEQQQLKRKQKLKLWQQHQEIERKQELKLGQQLVHQMAELSLKLPIFITKLHHHNEVLPIEQTWTVKQLVGETEEDQKYKQYHWFRYRGLNFIANLHRIMKQNTYHWKQIIASLVLNPNETNKLLKQSFSLDLPFEQTPIFKNNVCQNKYADAMRYFNVRTKAQVNRAFKLAALANHPDKHNGSKVSKEKFQEINEQYEFLKKCPTPPEFT